MSTQGNEKRAPMFRLSLSFVLNHPSALPILQPRFCSLLKPSPRPQRLPEIPDFGPTDKPPHHCSPPSTQNPLGPPSPTFNLRVTHSHSRMDPSTQPTPLLPLHEVAGSEGVVRVPVSFSLSDLSQIERRLMYLQSFRVHYGIPIPNPVTRSNFP